MYMCIHIYVYIYIYICALCIYQISCKVFATPFRHSHKHAGNQRNQYRSLDSCTDDQVLQYGRSPRSTNMAICIFTRDKWSSGTNQRRPRLGHANTIATHSKSMNYTARPQGSVFQIAVTYLPDYWNASA